MEPLRAAVAVALAALTLAGCAEGPGEGPTAPDVPDPGRSSRGGALDAANATLVRGEPIAVDFDGYAAAWTCVPDGPSSCVGTDLPTDLLHGPNAIEYEVDGAVVVRWLVALEATWDAATPDMEEILVWAGPYTKCTAGGPGCRQVEEEAVSVQGASPLRIDVTIEVGEPESARGFAIGVQGGMEWPGGLVGGLSTGQPVRVTGTLTPLVAVAP